MVSRLITIALVSGISSTVIIICSYNRVACHLQDPLKGFILAFAVVFYFMFCKKGSTCSWNNFDFKQ